MIAAIFLNGCHSPHRGNLAWHYSQIYFFWCHVHVCQMWCFYHKMHDSLIFGHLAAGLISRCPLSRIPFSRTSLISPSTRLALRASLFLNDIPRIHQTFRCVIYIYVYLLYRLGYSSNVRALSKCLRVRVRLRAANDLRSFELRAFRPMSCILLLSIFHCCCIMYAYC